MRQDLELSSTRIQGSSALCHCTRVSSPQQHPEASSSLVFRLGSTLSVNTVCSQLTVDVAVCRKHLSESDNKWYLMIALSACS